MSPAVVLDTCVWIELGRSEAAAAAILEQRWRLRLSAVVLSELLRGMRSTAEKRFVRSLARSFPAIVPNVAHWIGCGDVLAKLRDDDHFDRRGLQLIQNDVLIALAARDLGLPVVTTNVDDYQRIARLARGVKVIAFGA